MKTILSSVTALAVVGVMIGVNNIPAGAQILNVIQGVDQRIDNGGVDTDGLDLDFYPSDFSDQASLVSAQDAFRARVVDEGTTLLKNEGGTLPLARGTSISFFGSESVAETSALAAFMEAPTSSLKDSFEGDGFTVNESLWSLYSDGACASSKLGPGSIDYGDAEDFSINECPLDTVLAAPGVEESISDTVPVYVMRRVAGEGRDMPRSMYQHTDVIEDQSKTYLEPNSVELEILQYLNDNFENVVLLINSNAALDLDWIEEFPHITSIVHSPQRTGEVSRIFAGAINPSGHTVDTFAARALDSPAAQNFGSFRYFTEDGEPTEHYYLSYAEGIYVGYKYYETRYEDAVMGTGNAGDFDYAQEVVFPFGHGLSYTDFAWSDFTVTDNGDDTFTLATTVTNTGDVAGKDAVGFYVQKPYTDYDRANGVEKAAVDLVNYAKTTLLDPGASETVTVTVDREQLKSYDSKGEGTYILEPGKYYFTSGADAHAAINNILAAKGFTTADGMTADGDASLVGSYEPTMTAIDLAYATDTTTGTEIVNQFDFANADVTYLSRADWTGTFPEHDGTPSDELSTWGNEINGTDAEGNPASFTWMKEISEEGLAKLNAFDSGSPIDRTTLTADPVFGARNGLTLSELRGLEQDDPKWDMLLDQLRPEDYQELIGRAGYGNPAVSSIDKPYLVDADTAKGPMTADSKFMIGSTLQLAQMWDPDAAYEFGNIIGNTALNGSLMGWYAPAANIHRTPFSGRNGEYYSEDPYLSGRSAQETIRGVSEKGIYPFIKHFAFNDQENHRGDRDGNFGVATFGNEQSLREIYLQPFEMAFKAGDFDLKYVAQNEDGSLENAHRTIRGSTAVMTAFNRIGYTWTGGSYALLSGVLRGEWGFEGFAITDNANTGVFMDAYQMIEAGGDAKLTSEHYGARWEFNPDDDAEYLYARDAVHRILYTVVNSKAYNGVAPGGKLVDEPTTIDLAKRGVNIGGGLILATLAWFTFRRHYKARKVATAE